jgi:hypothetical protein
MLLLWSAEGRTKTDLMTPLRAFLATLPVVVAVVGRDVVSLFSYPFPVGVDGFYYAEQIKSILANGTLYYPSRTPLVFYLIAGVCGKHNDVVKCIKLTSIAIEISLFLGFWMLLWRLTRSCWITWWGVVIISLLPSHLFLLADFTKELLCFALLAWSAICIHAGILRRRHWLYGAGLALFLLALLSHLSALLLLVALAIGAGVLKLSGKHRYLIAIVIVITWCAGFVVASSPSFSWFFQTASLNLPPGGTTWWTAERLAILTVTAAILVGNTASVELQKLPMLIFRTVALVSLCITANPGLSQNSDFLFGRASMTANLQLGLLVPGLLYCRRREANGGGLWPMYGILVGFLCLSIASPPQVRGLDAAYLRRRAQLVDVLLQTKIPDEHAVVIAPQGDQFAVTYLTGLSSQHSWTAGLTVPVYWLLFGMPTRPTSLPVRDYREGPRRYVLQSDTSLRKEWQAYDDEVRDRLIQNNPELLGAGYTY